MLVAAGSLSAADKGTADGKRPVTDRLIPMQAEITKVLSPAGDRTLVAISYKQ